MRQHRCEYCEARLVSHHCSARCAESEREDEGYQLAYDTGFAGAPYAASLDRDAWEQGASEHTEAAERAEFENGRKLREGERDRRAWGDAEGCDAALDRRVNSERGAQ